MKVLRVAGIQAILAFCVAMALGQETSHDMDKGAAKTGQVVKHVGKKVGDATKFGVKSAGQDSCQRFGEGRQERVGEDWSWDQGRNRKTSIFEAKLDRDKTRIASSTSSMARLQGIGARAFA